ncbi:GNAT family N-acetyltransferase [Rhizorhabdus sp.]|uniref:GNAT family N-acetyltransferase n=1 Tax=Rhizorhabdus sp. TaxID=1968843 RepID=UPI0035B4D6CD
MTIPPASLLADAEPPTAATESKREYQANAIQWAVLTALLAAPARDNAPLRAFLASRGEGPEAEPCTPAAEVCDFSCGVASLDEGLRRDAAKSAARRDDNWRDDAVRDTFVVLQERRVLAYFTQRLCFVRRPGAELATEARAKAETIPLIQLQRLAVDRSVQGRGVGSALLRQAVLRAASLARNCSAPALWVPSLSAETRRFYLARGMQPFPVILDPLGVLLTFDTVRKAMASGAVAEDRGTKLR